MALTQTEIEGLAKGFLGLVDEQAATFTGKPVDLAGMRKTVAEKLENVVRKNARQEGLKIELRKSTQEVDAANDDLYRTVSGFLDALIGVAGKGSPVAQNMQRLRSRVRQPDGTAASPVEPVQGAPK